jgi:hypothetical protein
MIFNNKYLIDIIFEKLVPTAFIFKFGRTQIKITQK